MSVLTIQALKKELARWRLHSQCIVFTNGCFDLVHAGHIALLKEASAQGDKLILGLNDDASVARLKGKERPINPLKNRAEVLQAIRYVDAVIPFSQDTPLQLIKDIQPDVLVKGSDYKEHEVVGRAFAGRVHLAEIKEGLSTTALVNRFTKH